MTYEYEKMVRRGPRSGGRLAEAGIEVLEEQVTPVWIEGIPVYLWQALMSKASAPAKSVSMHVKGNPFEDESAMDLVEQAVLAEAASLLPGKEAA